MERVCTPQAPNPAGHYEQGWTHAGLVYVSGQLPIDPSGKTKGDTTAGEQATQALGNVKAVLEAAGSRLDRVLKVTVYVSDIALWSEIDAAYRAFFGGHKPARSVVPTRDLHYGFKVEVDAIAAI